MGCINSVGEKLVYIVQKQPIQLSCKICYVTFNNQQNQPMVIPCGHTICSACLKTLTKSECPFDRTKFDKDKAYKNIEVVQLVDQRAEIRKRQLKVSNEQPVLCLKKHKMMWSGHEQSCIICQTNRGGWKCTECKTNICTFCSKKKPTKKCYNAHNTEWRGVKIRCVSCDHFSSGWQCQQCSYNLCTNCTQTAKETVVCPNGHPTRWNYQKEICCVMCNLKQSGMCCKQCIYNVCKVCRPVKTMVMRCPNNHPTQWCHDVENISCDKCSTSYSGFLCRQCSYLICTQCSGWNCKEKRCPNKHAKLLWVAIINDCINTCLPSDGFRCANRDCQFAICRKCISEKPKPQICFNGHETRWKTQIGSCQKCFEKSSGWQCEQCGYYFCSKCTSTVIQGIKCPNHHAKKWRVMTALCQLCRLQQFSGLFCKDCDLFTCDKCERTDLTRSTCPNGHTLYITEFDAQCIVCYSIDRCWSCKDCEFYGCLKCIKRKLNGVNCPNSHTVQLITREEMRRCIRCKKYSLDFYECDKQCLPICKNCINS